MLNQQNKNQLKILRKFLTEQISGNFLNELSDVLSRMSIYTFAGGAPAVISIWHDWKECWRLYTNSFEEESDEQVIARSFMAAFTLLNEVFWMKDNEVTIEFVIKAIDDCLADIANNRENELWSLWGQYLQREEGLRYRFAESIILPIIIERQVEGLKHYNFIQDALPFMRLQEIQKNLYRAFDAEGKTLKVEYRKSQTFFLLKWLLFIFNILRFSSTEKKYCFEVSLSRFYEDKKEYLESALSEYLEKYGLSSTNKSLPTLISLLKEVN